MMAFIGRNWSPLFSLMKYKIVVSDEVYILFHFNFILKYNGMYCTKIPLISWPLKIGSTCYPDKSVINYNYTQPNIPVECTS